MSFYNYKGEILVFFDIFTQLCEEKGVAPSRVALDIGIHKSSVTTWRTKGFTPNAETLQKLANYFGVSVDYLLTGKEEEHDISLETQDSAAEFGKQLFASYGNIAPEDFTQADLDDIAMFMQLKKNKKKKEE